MSPYYMTRPYITISLCVPDRKNKQCRSKLKMKQKLYAQKHPRKYMSVNVRIKQGNGL